MVPTIVASAGECHSVRHPAAAVLVKVKGIGTNDALLLQNKVFYRDSSGTGGNSPAGRASRRSRGRAAGSKTTRASARRAIRWFASIGLSGPTHDRIRRRFRNRHRQRLRRPWLSQRRRSSAADFPAVRWKLANLDKLKQSNPQKHKAQRDVLESSFGNDNGPLARPKWRQHS